VITGGGKQARVSSLIYRIVPSPAARWICSPNPAENGRLITKFNVRSKHLMKPQFPVTPHSAAPLQPHSEANARIILLVALGVLLGIGGSAVWYQRSGKAGEAGRAQSGRMAGDISDTTRAILSGLESPIEIRYFSILDPASVPKSLSAFAGRVDHLLAAYQDAANGKLTVTRYTTGSDSGPQTATSDGLKPFNLDKGDACFLGVTVLGNNQKETFARLSPEWEAALESDLSRAIARLSAPAAPTGAAAFSVQAGQAAIVEVKKALPNLATLNVEEGTRLLRESALKEAQASAEQMKDALQAAQQRLAQTRESGSDAEQQAALKDFELAQAEQAAKLKEITLRLQAQIDALKQLKAE